MNTSELRRGNMLIGIPPLGYGIVTFIVDTIDEHGVNAFLTNTYDFEYYTELTPVPLTTELLIAFGFEKISFFYVYEKIWIRAANIDESGFYLADKEGEIFGIPILHVHQLQNLIYALTGKEITLMGRGLIII